SRGTRRARSGSSRHVACRARRVSSPGLQVAVDRRNGKASHGTRRAPTPEMVHDFVDIRAFLRLRIVAVVEDLTTQDVEVDDELAALGVSSLDAFEIHG